MSMSSEFVTVRNLLTGGVGRVRRRIAEHDILGEHYEIVPDGTKPKVSIETLVAEKAAKTPKPAPKPAEEDE